jgi:polar amino acid transport system substrate-binding protein
VYQSVAQLDHLGARLAVGKGAAYDLYLSRTLSAAELVRAPTSAAAVEWFLEQGLEAAAGVRQPLEAFADKNEGYRVLADSFTEIRQAMAVPKGRKAGAEYVRAFLDRKISSGFVLNALLASGQGDVRVGPTLNEQRH